MYTILYLSICMYIYIHLLCIVTLFSPAHKDATASSCLLVTSAPWVCEEPASDWPHWPKEKKPQGLQAAKPARPSRQVGQGEPWSSCCGWGRPGGAGPRSLATPPGSCTLQTGSRQWVPHGEEPLKCSNGNFWKNELLSWHSCFSLFTLQALHWNM